MKRGSDDLRGLFRAARSEGRPSLDEPSGKRILSAYGIEVPRSVLARNADDLDGALRTLSPPLVLKIVSPDAIHKSDIGGVVVGLRGKQSLLDAMRSMEERAGRQSCRMQGFLIEEMVPAGTEVVIGGMRDPSFGPVLMFGLGGIFVEIVRDVAFRICPIDRFDAVEMIHELRAAPLLSGARGRAPVDEAALVRTLLSVGGEAGLLLDMACDIAELDINPLIVAGDKVVAVDARIILKMDPA